MTKAQLLAALAGKYSLVAPDDRLIGTYKNNITLREIQVVEVSGPVASVLDVRYYVKDEGLPAEAAFWAVAEPKPAASVSVENQLYAFIDSKVADGTIQFATVEYISPTQQRAVVLAVGNDMKYVRYLLDKGGAGGALRIRAITP